MNCDLRAVSWRAASCPPSRAVTIRSRYFCRVTHERVEGALVLSLCSEALPVSSLASTGWAMADVGELQALVQKERATSRDNLKKVMAISKEKKDVEAQLSAQAAAAHPPIP